MITLHPPTETLEAAREDNPCSRERSASADEHPAVALIAGGAALAFIPGLPRISLDPALEELAALSAKVT